jgi:enoyl-CoA hydratase/carnithine racemase
MTSDVAISRADRIQTIRIARPAKKNALTGAMYEALTAALDAGDRDPDVACHLIVGDGGCFTAGNDIGDFLAHSRSGSLPTAILDFLAKLPRIDKPLIAAVDGPAVGIGTTLLLHCDLVYASPTAAFATPFLDLGLVPEAGSSLLAPLRMGHARAFELLVLGEIFSAERAREAGLVNAVVAHAELESTARAAALRLAAKPPTALAASRRLMRGEPDAIVGRINKEVAIFAEQLRSPEAREAFQAFLEKRKPDFAKLRRQT